MREIITVGQTTIPKERLLEVFYQLHLGETPPKKFYFYLSGTIVYPRDSGRRVVQDVVFAVRNKDKVRGYAGFTALNSVRTYLDGWREPLHQGQSFGAPVKLAHQINLKQV